MEVIFLLLGNFIFYKKPIYLFLFFQVMFPQPQQLQSSQIQFIPWTLLDFIGKDKLLAHHIVTYIQRLLPQVSWLFLVAILITILQFHMAPSVTVQMSSPMIWCAINGTYYYFLANHKLRLTVCAHIMHMHTCDVWVVVRKQVAHANLCPTCAWWVRGVCGCVRTSAVCDRSQVCIGVRK